MENHLRIPPTQLLYHLADRRGVSRRQLQIKPAFIYCLLLYSRLSDNHALGTRAK
jgi:hypothetical protein